MSFLSLLSFVKKIIGIFLGLIVVALASGCAEKPTDRPWISSVRHELGYLGARNWIVIAESAFPIPSKAGLRVIRLDADIPEVLDGVEDVIAETHHVRPRVYVAEELSKVPYDYAPGIDDYRKEFEEALHGRETIKLDNSMLMRMLMASNKNYRVLVIKTRTSLPYSSVFIELGSGYWDAESESVLRAQMEKKNLKQKKKDYGSS